MKFVKVILIGAVVIAGAAYAKGDRTDPNAKARSDLMRDIGKNIGVLGDIAGGKAAYDAAAAEAAKAALIADAAAIETAFKDQGAADPASEAKPEIWTDNAKFKEAGDKMQAEMVKLAAAARTGNLDAIKTAVGSTGGSCKACHDAFRKE